MDTEEEVHQQMTSAGWEVDGSFSEHLAIGEAGDLCMIVPAWVVGSEEVVYELYDVSRNISHWVREVPTPEQAAELLNKHGKTPPVEEEEEQPRGWLRTGGSVATPPPPPPP